MRRRIDTSVRAHGLRPPRTWPPVRVLRGHGRRLGTRDGRPRVPAGRRARRPHRRASGLGRADGVRRARQSVATPIPRRSSSAPARWACSRWPRSPTATTRTTRHRSSSPPATRTSRPIAKAIAADRADRALHRDNAPEAGLDGSPAVGVAPGRRPADGRVRSRDRLRRLVRVDHTGDTGRRARAARSMLVGMPGDVSLDLTERVASRGVAPWSVRLPAASDFDTAIDIIRRFDLGRLVSATYRLDEHVDAIAHAAAAGRRGAVKIAFDLRPRMRRTDPDAASRFRARGRPLDAADPVLAGRGVQPREAARRPHAV